MATKSREEKDDLLVNGYSRSISIISKLMVPSDIIQLFYLFYHEIAQILQFSDIYTEKGAFSFHQNRQLIQRIGAGHTYILMDCEPVTKGIHCWRVHTVARNAYGWIMWGISEKRKHRLQSYREAYGMSKHDGQWYMLADRTYHSGHNNCNKKQFMNLQEGDVDMLLDVDKGTLNICVVGHCDNNFEAKMFNLPLNKKWVPHFNVNNKYQELVVAKIPIDWYGKYKDDLFKDIIDTSDGWTVSNNDTIANIWNDIRDEVEKQFIKDHKDFFTVFEAIGGQQQVVDKGGTNYRININISAARNCQISVFRSPKPFKYRLKKVQYGT